LTVTFISTGIFEEGIFKAKIQFSPEFFILNYLR